MTNGGGAWGCGDAGQRGDSDPGRDGADGVNSYQLLRIVCDINFMNCLFLDFPFYIFGPPLTMGNWN